MKKIIIGFILLHLNFFNFAHEVLATESSATDSINETLDSFHQAAAQANFKRYFDLLTDNAIFLGTDASERWTKTEFKLFVQPYFSQGKGWLYQVKQRNITLNSDGNSAFFDELLYNQNYGQCRGSGVLYKTSQGWKIAQYNLSVPLPNLLTKELVKQIKHFQQAKSP